MFHHARPFEFVEFGEVTQARDHHGLSCPDPDGARCDASDDRHWDHLMDVAYSWLEEQIGYWPLFMACGSGRWALEMTGYPRQFGGWHPEDPHDRLWNDQVMFTYDSLPHPDVRFTDYDWWHIVLNSVHCRGHHDTWRVDPSDWGSRTIAHILKPSWSTARWMRHARQDDGNVQAHAPVLDLREADAVFCRNQARRRDLIRMGFSAEKVFVAHATPA